MKSQIQYVLSFLTVLALISCSNSNSRKAGNQESNVKKEWKLVWADEFEGDTLNTNDWNYQIEPAGRFNNEWQRYTNSTNNAYVENSNLVIKAIYDEAGHGINHYTSARMNTAGKQTWKYGKISARIKLPYGQGIWPAFWMLGANINENGGDTPWPRCGEIDILELYGSKDDGVVEANLHYADTDGNHSMMGSEEFELASGKFADDYHVFELEWDAENISWLVDGQRYASTSITDDRFKDEFHHEMFILLNLAVGGTYADYPDASTVFPQYMYIDWVRVYEEASK